MAAEGPVLAAGCERALREPSLATAVLAAGEQASSRVTEVVLQEATVLELEMHPLPADVQAVPVW